MSDLPFDPWYWNDYWLGRLVRFQLDIETHSYTCRDRDKTPHAWRMGDFGGLTPTRGALVCEQSDCGYRQEWYDPDLVHAAVGDSYGRVVS